MNGTASPTVPAEPIAILGMGCRLPGGIESPEEFWEFLRAGKDAVAEIPADRWQPYEQRGAAFSRAMRNTTRRGGFLNDPGAFDHEFFSITPREAELMDPQQRIALEVTWEALEHAGLPASRLAGSDTAVYMGVGSDDYGRAQLEDLPTIEAWTGIGASPCAVANRVSYLLDLHGASMSVDTACSSSLVAIHLACTALRAGETSVAIAGGVHLIAAPGLSMVLDAAGATSPDGRSKPFDAEANGYGRGEGAGVLVLKRLADAERDGDRILGVIRGSAVRQDGRTNGIMAPNGDAQAEVARAALDQAGIDPASIGYVEAHGTGTRAGDPIEAAGLSAVFGRPDGPPCPIGSVKGNIGHLEAGAGVAGVIKAVLAMNNGEIPPQAGFTTPNPAIDWDRNGLTVVDQLTRWPDGPQPRRAGVSAFGYGGTVGHVVLEQHRDSTVLEQHRENIVLEQHRDSTVLEQHRDPAGSESTALTGLFPITGQSSAAVREYAAKLADHLALAGAADPAELADVEHTLWYGRDHLPRRAAVLATDATTLRYELRKLAGDQASPGVTTGNATDAPADPVWVFSGHGSQWAGMGRELLATEAAFADVIDTIEPIFQAELGFSPRVAISSGEHGEVDRVQALIFAVQLGIAAVWRARGLRPAAVIGHSVGEVAAAVTAGVFSLADGARLICRRSRQVGRAAGGGTMALIGLPFADVQARIETTGSSVVAAIESSPLSTVIAGTADAIEAFSTACAAEDILVRKVASDVAFHSPQMDPLLPDLVASLTDLVPGTPQLPIYSTALADPRAISPAGDTRHGPEYWAQNLRNPVRLATAVSAAAADGHRLFLELSAHPVVTHSITETLDCLGIDDGFCTGSLRRAQPEGASLLTNLAGMYCHGARFDLDRLSPAGRLTTLPRTAWQHTRFWRLPMSASTGSAGAHDPLSGSLLGGPVDLAGSDDLQVWQTILDDESRPYTGRHPVQGVEVVPAAALLTTLFAAAGGRNLSQVRLRSALSPSEPCDVQVVRRGDDLRLSSRPTGGTTWQLNTTAQRSRFAPPPTPETGPELTEVAAGIVLDTLHANGIADTGLPWRVESIWLGAGAVRADFTVGEHPRADDPALAWACYLDAVTSAAPLAFGLEPGLRLLAGLDRVELADQPPNRLRAEIRAGDGGRLDLWLSGPDGECLGFLGGLRFAGLEDSAAVSRREPAELVHPLSWQPVGPPTGEGSTSHLVVGAGHLAADELASRLQADPAVDTVLVLGTPGSDGTTAHHNAEQLATAAQAIAGLGRPRPPRLYGVTAGLAEAGPDSLAQASMTGLGRIIGGEHPDLWGGLIDTGGLGTGDADPIAAALTVAGRYPAADEWSVRGSAVRVARFGPVATEQARPPLSLHADASYLVTGGLGVLGLQVAHWLVEQGARRLVLTARTPLPPRSSWPTLAEPHIARRIKGILALEALGAGVQVVTADSADRAAMARAIDPDVLGWPPIRGVVHLAGVLDNKVLTDLDTGSLARVMHPKVGGALVLDATFPPGSLDFLVLFSSIGQYLGLMGQASYAASNSVLDALARRRRAAGAADTLSLSWTSWQGLGMAVSEIVDEELRTVGVGAISADEAFASWSLAWQRGLDHAGVFPLVAEPIRTLALLSELEFDAPAETGTAPTGLADLPAEARTELIRFEVAGIIAAEIRVDAADFDLNRPLKQLGLDSVISLAIRRRLEKRFGLALPATLMWNQPDAAGVAAYLDDLLTPDEQD